MPLGMEVGLSSGDSVLDGDPATLTKKGADPQFSAHVYCFQTAGWIKMPLGTEVGLDPNDIVLHGAALLPPKGHSAFPQFSANVYCGQTAAWIKMPLGTEVGLGPDDIVLDADQAPPPQKGGRALFPIFGPCLLWRNGWMDQDGIWHAGRPWSIPHCARWGPSSLPKRGQSPPIFGPILLWPNGLMHRDVTCYGSKPCVRWGPNPSP